MYVCIHICIYINTNEYRWSFFEYLSHFVTSFAYANLCTYIYIYIYIYIYKGVCMSHVFILQRNKTVQVPLGAVII